MATLAHRYGALLICDEVITGFRLRYGAAYETYGATPDLIMLGKIIGGGMPIGAVAGRAELMDLLAPSGPVYQAGTLSGNPLSVRAGSRPSKSLPNRVLTIGLRRRARGLRRVFEPRYNRAGCAAASIGSVRSRRCFSGWSGSPTPTEARGADTAAFTRFFHAMLARGVYLPPSQFEAMFISLAHTDADLDATVAAAHEALAEVARA